ncbi:MAG: hypothetical protein F6K31_30250 [Symploca sp. SIO2G7]|nr:hypothetical protein [Symploca sp. SIO2G7]
MRSQFLTICCIGLSILGAISSTQAAPIFSQTPEGEKSSVKTADNSLILTGSLKSIDGRWRGDIKRHISLGSGWTDSLQNISANINYFNQADVCAGEVATNLYTTAFRLDNGQVVVGGKVELHHGRCAFSHATLKRREFFQCIVAPGDTARRKFRLRSGDDKGEINLGIRNTGTRTQQHYQTSDCYLVNQQPY